MVSIDRLSAVPASFATGGTHATDARGEAAGAIGEIGHRLLAWVQASGGGATNAAWSQVSGSDSRFRPDAGELARGGDVYDLGGLARDIAGRLGGTPTQEGELHRALADFTRASAVQVAGLAGSDRQMAGITNALGASNAVETNEGVDGVIDRLDAATASLDRESDA